MPPVPEPSSCGYFLSQIFSPFPTTYKFDVPTLPLTYCQLPSIPTNRCTVPRMSEIDQNLALGLGHDNSRNSRGQSRDVGVVILEICPGYQNPAIRDLLERERERIWFEKVTHTERVCVWVWDRETYPLLRIKKIARWDTEKLCFAFASPRENQYFEIWNKKKKLITVRRRFWLGDGGQRCCFAPKYWRFWCSALWSRRSSRSGRRWQPRWSEGHRAAA